MDSYSQRKAAEAQAQQQIEVAQAKLAAVKAGAKEGEIEAQRAEIARLESEREGNIEAQKAIVAKLKSELVNAETEFDRYNWLYEEGAVSASQRDSKQLVLDTTRNSLKEAQATLDRIRSSSKREINRAKATLDHITQVRPVDVEVAQAEVEQAVKAQEEARATLDQSIVRSPIDGEILYIHTRPGEVVASDGIVEIGQTRQMKVVAEVYQSDVGKVKPGQRVKVISEVMPEELTGTVERIASQVTRQNIVNTDPSANIDARVVEVHIKLDGVSSQKAAKFTNLQVKAVIGL
jgi:HlyD family secretion protein